ncbi:Spy/CpxP family protein refolding chaperone [Peijinzhouia sedimentorum]
MRKQMIFTLALLFVSLVSADLMAQKVGAENQQERQRPMMQNRMQQGQGQRAMNVFTEEQKEAMKQLRLEHLEATTPLRNELNELRASQKSLMASESPDQGQINAVIDRITQINGQLLKERAAQQIEFRALLTDEQRIKMDAMRANRGERGAKMRQGQQGRRQSEGRRSMAPRRPMRDR